jgi:hypothetical protein
MTASLVKELYHNPNGDRCSEASPRRASARNSIDRGTISHKGAHPRHSLRIPKSAHIYPFPFPPKTASISSGVEPVAAAVARALRKRRVFDRRGHPAMFPVTLARSL